MAEYLEVEPDYHSQIHGNDFTSINDYSKYFTIVTVFCDSGRFSVPFEIKLQKHYLELGVKTKQLIVDVFEDITKALDFKRDDDGDDIEEFEVFILCYKVDDIIEIVYYSEVIDNFGRTESSSKGHIILSVLANPVNHNDDMIFEDKNRNRYYIDDLQGKTILIKDTGILTVPFTE